MRNPKAEKLVNRVTVQIQKGEQLSNFLIGIANCQDLYNMMETWIAKANRLLADGESVDDAELEYMISKLKRKRDKVQNRKTAIHKYYIS
jgi:hypothetical protein